MAATAVWDGSDDNGIDAAFYDETEAKVILVQSKWIKSGSGEPSAADIRTFCDGVRDLVEQNQEPFAARLKGEFENISGHLNKPGVSIEIVLISTGSSKLAKHGQGVLDKIVAELNGGVTDDPIASATVIGIDEIYSSMASGGTLEKITLDATVLDWHRVADPYHAYFGIMDGLTLKKWWTTHGKRLVAKNIRNSLGSTDVNNQIRLTAIREPEKFWYFNNGITLTADEAIKAPSNSGSKSAGNFQFKGASIVNGAQTVSTLGKIEEDEKLGNIRVPFRVILLKNTPEGFGKDVTRTNNLQNRIEARDFAAQDPEQSRLQNEMSVEGIEYMVLRSADFAPSFTSCDVTEVTTALACSSGDAQLAVAIKTGIGRFFADLSKPPYRAVFNPTVTGARAFNAVICQRVIDRWIDQKKQGIGKRSGYPWGVLGHGNRILSACVFKRLGRSFIDKTIKEFDPKDAESKIEIICEEVYTKMVDCLEINFPGKFLAVLFKNPTNSKAVFDAASAAPAP